VPTDRPPGIGETTSDRQDGGGPDGPASFLPLGVLLGSALLGAGVDAAVLAALICATALVFAAGWRVGREASLSLPSRLMSELCSGAFGAATILLKALLQ
jgi:hypothetical protein